MFNPESMLKALEKISSNFHTYVLSAPLTPSRHRRPITYFTSIQKSIKKLASKKIKEKPQIVINKVRTATSSPKKPRCLELLQLYTKKPTLELLKDLKLNTARAVFSRPTSSKASSVPFTFRSRFVNSKTLKVSVPQVTKNN